MKNEFIGYYELPEEEITNVWTTGVFVFDTNMLLHLYRYSESTRRDFFLVLDKLKEKLHLPYQVAMEYHANRRTVIHGLDTPYKECERIFKDVLQKTLKEKLSSYQRHPSINMEELEKLTTEFIQSIEHALSIQKQNKPEFIKKDTVRDKLDLIFNGKLGKDFSETELKEIIADGAKRYEKKIPPGYMDREEKSSARKIYGDFIIWKDLIEYAKREKKNIIFVTADLKEDWWLYDSAGKIPRPELIREFTEITKQSILIYDAEDFLKLAKERGLATEVSENSIEELKELREAEEIVHYDDVLKNIRDHHFHKTQSDLRFLNWEDYQNNLTRLSKLSSADLANGLLNSSTFVDASKFVEALQRDFSIPSPEALKGIRQYIENAKSASKWYRLHMDRLSRDNSNDGNKENN